VALAALLLAEPRAALTAGGRRGGRDRLPGRRRSAAERRGVHPPGGRLARIRVVPLLVSPGPVGVDERARRRWSAAGGAGERRDRDGVSGRRRRWAARDRLRPPHRAADAVRQPRAAVRHRAPRSARLVPPLVHRRLRVGDGAERARDGDVGRRRRDDDQAVRRQRPLRRAHVDLLRGLPLRAGNAHRRRRVSVHDALLGRR
jgi:hypothetical protein